MSRFDEVEKAATAREARDAVGGSQRIPGSRTDEVKAALTRYLASEQYRERAASSQPADGDERQDSDESS